MLRLNLACLLATVLFTSGAVAHGAVSQQGNKCVLKIGPDIMYFTAYQPQSSREEFCDDIPSVGQMVVALDMQEKELRDMTTEIRIIKDLGTHTTFNGYPYLTDAELGNAATLDSATVFYLAPKKYPTGTLTFEHNFPEMGKFIGIVTVKNDYGRTYVSQFPFAVGTPGPPPPSPGFAQPQPDPYAMGTKQVAIQEYEAALWNARQAVKRVYFAWSCKVFTVPPIALLAQIAPEGPFLFKWRRKLQQNGIADKDMLARTDYELLTRLHNEAAAAGRVQAKEEGCQYWHDHPDDVLRLRNMAKNAALVP
jgi:hypothetical protein